MNHPLRRILFCSTFLFCVAPPASAHEFWLEPAVFAPRTGQSVPLAIRVGMDFKGKNVPFDSGDIKRFAVLHAGDERPIKASGNNPAINIKFPEPGLAVVVLHSTAETTTFETWEKFEAYLKEEGLEHIVPLHRQAGKPLKNIKESFSRYAKLLVAVGEGQGEDRVTGMSLELVAERNPYFLPDGEPFPVRLLYDGKPIQDVRIVAISKADPKNEQIVRTDADGRARIAIAARDPGC